MNFAAMTKDFQTELSEVEMIVRHTMSHKASAIDAAIREGTPDAVRAHAPFLVNFLGNAIAVKEEIKTAMLGAHEKSLTLVGSDALRIILGEAPPLQDEEIDTFVVNAAAFEKIDSQVNEIFTVGKTALTPTDRDLLLLLRDKTVDSDGIVPVPPEIGELRRLLIEDPEALPIVGMILFMAKVILHDIGDITLAGLRNINAEAADRIAARRRTSDALLDYLRTQKPVFEAMLEDA